MSITYTVGDVVQLELRRGDKEDFYIQWLADGVAVDLTGYAAELLNSDGAAITAAVTVPTPADGTIHISFASAQTTVMNDQFYRLRVYQGSNVKTLLEGRLNLT